AAGAGAGGGAGGKGDEAAGRHGSASGGTGHWRVMRLKAFQELATRARGQVTAHQVSMSVCVFVYDLLYLHGQPLLGLGLRQRRALLPLALPLLPLLNTFVELASSTELLLHPAAAATPNVLPPDFKPPAPPAASQLDSMAASVQQPPSAPSRAAAGLMLKRLDGPGSSYEPSKRSGSWVKLKADYCEGLRDSLDLVVIGAWHGSGRKAGWLSPFLLAAWDPDSESLQSVCRCMSGFSDAFYAAATQRLLATAIP
ncbi:DNA ligase, partial [Haematococcus lacustris]